MKAINYSLLFIWILFTSTFANAAGSMLRVTCEGDDIGAEVLINGKFRGECPVDLQVPSGRLQLVVRKEVDDQHERVFEQDIRMGEGSVKKVEAVLNTQLNAAAQKRKDEQVSQELVRNKELHQRLLKAAMDGDNAAMLGIGDLYSSGTGIEQNAAKATEWYQKAAAAGSEVATFKLSNAYRTKSKQDVEDISRILALPIEQQRDVNITGKTNILAFIEGDSFFETAGGNQKISYSFSLSKIARRTVTCSRNGRFVQLESATEFSDSTAKGTGAALLGGLVTYQYKTTGHSRDVHQELNQLSSINGQPFPLTPGKRFGLTHTYTATAPIGDATYTEKISCAVLADPARPPPQAQGSQTTHVACLIQSKEYPDHYSISWQILDNTSGCFLPRTSKKL